MLLLTSPRLAPPLDLQFKRLGERWEPRLIYCGAKPDSFRRTGPVRGTRNRADRNSAGKSRSNLGNAESLVQIRPSTTLLAVTGRLRKIHASQSSAIHNSRVAQW